MPHDPHFPLARQFWKPPFQYVPEGAYITDANHAKIVDVRGWGHLTGQGAHALPEAKAEPIQDEIGRRLTCYLNNHWTI